MTGRQVDAGQRVDEPIAVVRARQLAAALPTAGRKVDLAQLRSVFVRLWPDRLGSADARRDLAALLAAGEDACLWELPVVAGKAWDRSAQPPLPTFVRRPTSGRPAPVGPSATKRLLGEVLEPPLTWAYELKALSRGQLDDVVAVNRWLREVGSDDVPLVPREERSLEVFGDEKHVADRLQNTTAVWTPGRLDETLLRCHPSWSPLPHVVFAHSGTLLIAENRSTFWSLSTVLGEHEPGPVAAVGWGEGLHLPTLLRSVVELPLELERICYFGDVDGDGLAIAVAAAQRAVELDLPTVEPARSLYELLAMHARPAADTTKLPIGQRHLAWLPDTVRGWAAELASSRHRAAQEAVGRQVLTSHRGWVDHL